MPALELDAWPRRPVDGVTPLLQPVAHVLVHAKQELPRVLANISSDQLWVRPAGVDAIGFHLAHIAGNLDRLLAHARGRQLTAAQRELLSDAGIVAAQRPGLPDLLGRLDIVLDDTLAYLRTLSPERLLETREIGEGGPFVTVFDLLSSAAEHTSRHLGQIATTARVVQGV